MFRFLCVVGVLAVTSGCVTFGSIEKNIQSRYVGKPADVAIDSLGYPTAERTILGRKVLTWTVGRSLPTLGSLPSGQVVITGSASYSCTLDLELDSANVVTKYGLSGQLGACEAFKG